VQKKAFFSCGSLILLEKKEEFAGDFATEVDEQSLPANAHTQAVGRYAL